MSDSTEHVVPAIAGVIHTDRHYLKCKEQPRLSSGISLAVAVESDAWELPAPSSHRIVREVVWVGGESVELHRKAFALRPSSDTVSTESHILLGGEHGCQSDVDETAGQCISFLISNHSQFILSYIDEHSLFDPDIVVDGDGCWSHESHFVGILNQYREEQRTEPPIDPIHKVEGETKSVIEYLRVNMRRMLKRERRLTPISLVETIDPPCIEWLVRQPGRTVPEKAGAKQEILAVQRDNTVDTYENRIFKAFLRLAVESATKYLTQQNVRRQDFTQHNRYVRINKFKQLAADVLASEIMVNVADPSSDDRPNYALQFSEYYSPIWTNYLRLLSLRRQQDDLWRWRHRILGECLFFDLLSALHDMTNTAEVPIDGEIGLLTDPEVGNWMSRGTYLTPRNVNIDGKSVLCHLSLPVPLVDKERNTPTISDVKLTLTAIGQRTSVREYNFTVLAHGLSPDDEPMLATDSFLVIPDLEAKPTAPELNAKSAIQTGVYRWPNEIPDRMSSARALISQLTHNLVTNT